MTTLRRDANPCDPQDILDAAKHLGVQNVRSSYFLDETWRMGRRWTPSEDYLAWARVGLAEGGEHGWDRALSYAKRAVCRRIDSFLVYNHLRFAERYPFPAKIEL